VVLWREWPLCHAASKGEVQASNTAKMKALFIVRSMAASSGNYGDPAMVASTAVTIAANNAPPVTTARERLQKKEALSAEAVQWSGLTIARERHHFGLVENARRYRSLILAPETTLWLRP
jgi:hypothetical protein